MEMNGRNTVLCLVLTPRVPFFVLTLKGLEAKGLLLSFPGRRGISSIVRWKLRPVMFSVEKGRFCKRAVLANVPSFQFFCTVVLFLVPSVQEHRFLYPHSGFWGSRNIRQNHPSQVWKPPFYEPYFSTGSVI